MAFNIFALRDKRLREGRQSDQDKIQQQLINAGLSPSEINDVVKEYVRTGDLRLPTERKTGKFKMREMFDGQYGPGEPVAESVPIELPRNKVIGIDKNTGESKELYSGPTAGRVDRVLYGKDEKAAEDNKVGNTIYIRAKDGKEIRREPNGRTYDTYVRVGASGAGADGGGGGRPETPQEKLARAAITRYYDALKSGYTPEDMPEELLNAATSAADFLGMSLEDVPSTRIPEQPGVVGRFFGKKAEDIPPQVTVPRFRKDVVQPNVLTEKGQGKSLSPELAKDFLNKAGGDKNKARKMARDAGYRF